MALDDGRTENAAAIYDRADTGHVSVSGNLGSPRHSPRTRPGCQHTHARGRVREPHPAASSSTWRSCSPAGFHALQPEQLGDVVSLGEFPVDLGCVGELVHLREQHQ